MTLPRRPTVYPSAVDRWLIFVVMLGPIFAAGFGVRAWLGGDAAAALMLFFAGGCSLLVAMAFMIPCRYTILDDALSIRCGILFFQVRLDEITKVQKSATRLSGPALSLRRVQITTPRRSYIVSPQDRDGFIDDLRQAISHVRSVANNEATG